MFKFANCRCCAPQTKKPKILGKWGQKIGLVGELFVKFSKIVLKFIIHNKKLIQSYSRLIFFSVVIALVYSQGPHPKLKCYPKMAVQYVQNLRTIRNSHLEPYCTSVPYFSSILEAYSIRTITKKAYRTSIPYFLTKVEAYRTYVRYCTAFRAFKYSQF